MSEPRWVHLSHAIRIHNEHLAIYGGAGGLRDLGLLDSAMSRPPNKFAYGETDLALLAASYAFGISRNHPFVDGNKRTAFLVMMTFLWKNDVAFAPTQVEATERMFELAAGALSEAEVANWVRGTR